MNNQDDRILLAKAMGLEYKDYGVELRVRAGSLWRIWDPFTSADDDYAVLKHMIKTYDVAAHVAGSARKQRVFTAFVQKGYEANGGSVCGYKKGNYARAAVSVLRGAGT